MIAKLDEHLRGSTTWRVFHQTIKNWLKDGDAMKHPSLDNYMMMMMVGQQEQMEKALKNQDKLGWNYALCGYLLSTSWVDLEHYTNRHPHNGIWQTWICTIIKSLWQFNKTMWTHQNSVLHSTIVPLCEHKESAVNSKIRYLFNQQHDFAVLDQVIFDTPLEVRLDRPLRSKKHWIRLAQRYHPSTYTQKTGKQHLITTFFPRLSKTSKTTQANLSNHQETTIKNKTQEERALHKVHE
jgi:hypothetical protein